MSDLALLGIGLVLTVGTGLFVAAEFALVNLDRHDVEGRAAGGEKRLGTTSARSRSPPHTCPARSWGSPSPPC